MPSHCDALKMTSHYWMWHELVDIYPYFCMQANLFALHIVAVPPQALVIYLYFLNPKYLKRRDRQSTLRQAVSRTPRFLNSWKQKSGRKYKKKRKKGWVSLKGSENLKGSVRKQHNRKNRARDADEWWNNQKDVWNPQQEGQRKRYLNTFKVSLLIVLLRHHKMRVTLKVRLSVRNVALCMVRMIQFGSNVITVGCGGIWNAQELVMLKIFQIFFFVRHVVNYY